MNAVRPNSAPLVAIATPVYNGAKYLAETMECVQGLDYPNLVHVVLDNASTDETPQIIDRFRNRRVPLLMARNPATIPLAANCNAVVNMVPENAKYFRLLCADDTMAPDTISRKVEIAERDPEIGIVGCQWRATGLCGEELPKDREVFDGKDMIRRFLRRETMVMSGTHVLIRRSNLAHQPFYDSSIVGFDTDTNLRICLNSKYGFIPEELAHWRMHEESITSNVTKSQTYLAEWLLFLDRYGTYVLGAREFRECRLAYRRHYLRRLLVIRWREGDKTTFACHMENLRLRDDEARPLDFADALIDWAYLAARGCRDAVGAPRRPRVSPHGAGIAPRPPQV